MKNLIILFIILNIVNVVLSTLKSIITVNGDKWGAAAINAITYFVYTYVLIYTSIDGMTMLTKAIIVGLCNFIGVYVVKVIENKVRKDKLWQVQVTIPASQAENMIEDCKLYNLTYNYINIEKYYLFNFYCPTQKHSAKVKKLLKSYDAKYFVNESKVL